MTSPDHEPAPPPATRRAGTLDERIGLLICPIAAAMVGVCLTGIGLLHVASAVRARRTFVDDLLATDALIFLVATLTSYLALRGRSHRRRHSLERIADVTFIVAMLLLTAACFLITYTLDN